MRPRLSVVVPALDEQDRIAETIAALRDSLAELGPGAVELIVVDDGSSDGTAQVAERGGADRVVRLSPNRGKGAAVRAGVSVASGATVAYTDADLSYPPGQLLGLLAEVERGSRFVAGNRKHVETVTLLRGHRLREVSGRVFNLLSRLVVLGAYRDTQCGMKAFESNLAKELFAVGLVDGFAFDVELFRLAEMQSVGIVEVAVTVVHATSSSVRLGRDTRRMIGDLVRIRRMAANGTYARRLVSARRGG